MVLTATPSENALQFYLGQGFQPMAEPLAELFQSKLMRCTRADALTPECSDGAGWKRQCRLRHHLDVPGLPADEHARSSRMPICEEEH